MKFHLDCVFYYVSDIGSAIRFYQDILGFRLISRDAVARFDLDGIRFELVPAAAGQRLRAQGGMRVSAFV